jgi:fluoroacetyl-CoA thioesterase
VPETQPTVSARRRWSPNTALGTVTKVDGRRIEFQVRATEGDKEIGAGSHARAVIDMAKFARRLGP